MQRERGPMRLVRPDEQPTEGDDELVILVERARGGSQAAQAALFRRFTPSLLGLLVRLLGTRSDADDALQDTFVEAFGDLMSLREPRAFAGWLRQIAVHQAHRRFRRRRLLSFLGLDRPPSDGALERLVSEAASPEVRAQLGELDAVLAKLSFAERSAWMLRHVEGYALEEVAAMCGCSLATAKRRIAAASGRIAATLDVTEVTDDE